ncbi:Multiple C2 and transmembrane domain-containing protein 2 [Homalodisca vitripennis]|nr:Multiple C2 and transmembrane domain-containing protein 2 [Homalodisca vitripennis]
MADPKWFRRRRFRHKQYFQRSGKISDINRRLKSQIWSSVVTIVLVEGKNLLPMDIDGFSDPYVKFRSVLPSHTY